MQRRIIHFRAVQEINSIYHKLNFTPLMPIWNQTYNKPDWKEYLVRVGAVSGQFFNLGDSEPINIAMPTNEIIRYYDMFKKSFECTIFQLYLSNKKYIALPFNLKFDDCKVSTIISNSASK